MNISTSIPNIRCLVRACEELDIPYTYHDENHNFVGLTNAGKNIYFANATTPFNDESVARICKDKEFTYRLLKNKVLMPQTTGFLDPECQEKYRKYLKYFSYSEITQEIFRVYSLPLIIKKNAGAQGANVFLCTSEKDVSFALTTIYNKHSYLYDYIALAQQYIPIKKEYRVVMFNQKIVLMYEKDASQATCTGNISPLHQENSRAVLVKDTLLINRINNFLKPLFATLDLRFTGLDIILDDQNSLWLLEMNSRPGFEHFIQDNGDENLIMMYRDILLEISGQSVNV
jgi:glutathione synthase/RimK-type ligase-like ATP-grasp enzyme